MAVGAEPEQFKIAGGSGERRFATVNPATGAVVQEYPFLPSDQVTAVVEQAHQAFLSWRERPVSVRARVGPRARDLMLERADELARLITLEMGKLTAEAHGEAPLVASILHYYGEKGPGFLEPQP